MGCTQSRTLSKISALGILTPHFSTDSSLPLLITPLLSTNKRIMQQKPTSQFLFSGIQQLGVFRFHRSKAGKYSHKLTKVNTVIFISEKYKRNYFDYSIMLKKKKKNTGSCHCHFIL